MKYKTIICQGNVFKELLKFGFEAALVYVESQVCDSLFLKIMIWIYILNSLQRENSFD